MEFAISKDRSVVGVVQSDGSIYPRYRKTIMGSWVDCYPQPDILIDGKKFDYGWTLATRDQAQATVQEVDRG